MPIVYQHEMNPLVAGAAGWLSGFGKGRARDAEMASRAAAQQRAQNAQMQQQAFQAAAETMGHVVNQQLAYNNNVKLADMAHNNALARMNAAEQIAYRQDFYRRTGMSQQEADAQYDQMIQQDQVASGILTPAGPTVQADAMLQAYAPPMSRQDFYAQLATRNAAARKGMSLQQAGLEEYNPHEDEIKSLEGKLTQLPLDDTLDSDEVAFGQSEIQGRIARLKSAPPLVRARSPESYSVNDPQWRQQNVWSRPDGSAVIKFQGPRGTEFHNVPATKEGEAAKAPDPQALTAQAYQAEMQQYAQRAAVAQAAGIDPATLGPAPTPGEVHKKLWVTEVSPGVFYDASKGAFFNSKPPELEIAKAEAAARAKEADAEGKASEKRKEQREKFTRDAWADYYKVLGDVMDEVNGPRVKQNQPSLPGDHEFIRGKVWARMNPDYKQAVWSMQAGQVPKTPYDGEEGPASTQPSGGVTADTVDRSDSRVQALIRNAKLGSPAARRALEQLGINWR
jgi:hypothetical protein